MRFINKLIVTKRHNKKRGVRLLPFHVLRPSHCLSLSNNNAEAHADIKQYQHAMVGIKLYTRWASIVAKS